MEVLTSNEDMEEESNFINGVMENRLYSAWIITQNINSLKRWCAQELLQSIFYADMTGD